MIYMLNLENNLEHKRRCSAEFLGLAALASIHYNLLDKKSIGDYIFSSWLTMVSLISLKFVTATKMYDY